MKPYIFKGPRVELFGSPGVFTYRVYSRASGKPLGYVGHKEEGWKFWREGRYEPSKNTYKHRAEAAMQLWLELTGSRISIHRR